MSEQRPVYEHFEYLQVGHEPSRRGGRLRRVAGRLLIPLALAVIAAVAWSEMQKVEREQDVARADELAAAAVDALETDTELARLLALAAADTSLTPKTMAALRQSLATNLLDSYTWSRSDRTDALWTELSADGRLLVATGMSSVGRYVEVTDVHTGAAVWSTDTAEIGLGGVGIEFPFFSPDGELVIAGLTAEPVAAQDPFGVIVWDATTGDVVRQIGVSRCGAIVDAASDTHLLVTSPLDDSGTCWLERPARVELIDIGTGHRRLLSAQATWFQPRAMSADGRVVTFTAISPDGFHRALVVDAESGAELLAVNGTVYTHGLGHPRLLNNDGSLLLAGRGPVDIWDVASGMTVATVDVAAGSVLYAGFGPDGDSIFTTGNVGFHQWSARDGAYLGAVPVPGLQVPGMFSLAGKTALVSQGTPAVPALLLSTGPRRDVTTLDTCFGIAGPLSAASGHAALVRSCGAAEPVTFLIDLSAGAVGAVTGQLGQGLALSPDGSRFVRHDAPAATRGPPDASSGTIRIRDFATGQPVVDLETPDPTRSVRSATWSSDSSLVAAIDSEQEVVKVWDASSGRMVHRYDGCWFGVGGAAFTPSGDELIVSCRGPRLVALSTDDWTEVRTADLEQGLTLLVVVGFTKDGLTMLALDHADAGSLHWIDAETFDVDDTVQPAFDGLPTSWATDPVAGLAAIGTAGGRVQVWDLERRVQVDEIGPETSPIAGVGFTGDGRLAVAPREGEVLVYPLDPAKVIVAVRESVTRDLTPAECERYRFGDSCPSGLGDPAAIGAQTITGLPSGSAT